MDERGAINPHGEQLPIRRELAGSSVYGPVFSWRHGESVGVDLLLVESTCSFHCVYCQLGEIRKETRHRQVFVPTSKVLSDLHLVDWAEADAMTFSGSGEPTLAANLGDAIAALREETRKSIVVLTNGSLLHEPSVLGDLARADHVSCKLDAPTDELLQKINRPLAELSVEMIVQGLENLRREFDGCLSIQTMLLPTNEREADLFVGLLKRIAPDEVHLNVQSRPHPKEWELENRGAHRTFDNARAFRTVSRQEVLNFAGVIHAKTRIKVLTPPQITATALPGRSTLPTEERR